MVCRHCGRDRDEHGVTRGKCDGQDSCFEPIAFPDPRDAEIAALKAEVERLTVERAEEAASMLAAFEREEIRAINAEQERDQMWRAWQGCAGHDARIEADLAAHKRALAAGPAALHYRSCDCCSIVERAQSEAMKEDK